MTAAPILVVTGAAGGLGRAIAIEGLRRGFAVAAVVRTDDARATSLREEARGAGGQLDVLVADLTRAGDVDDLRSRVTGPVSLLVNCAGVLRESRLTAGLDDDWRTSFEINVRAPMLVARAFAPALAQARGAVVNVSSDGGVTGSVLGPAYGASKSALIGLTKTLARELAPDVRVNAVAPGPIDTSMWREADEADRRRVEAETPMGRVATPVEIARVCLDVGGWTFVTGQTLVVDGGRVI